MIGDSAGGHLAFSVTNLALLRGFRIPDAIFSLYPVLNTDYLAFYPSILISLDEEFMNQGVLRIATACVLRNGGNADKSCLLSPLVAPNSMVRKLPPCKIMCAEIDPLRDHSYSMALRILQLGGSCQLILMKEFTHPWLNFYDNKVLGAKEYSRGKQLL